MWYFDTNAWTEVGITEDAHKLLILHWEELFNLDTPDTWQVRAVNTRTALRELIEVIDTTLINEKFRHNVPTLLAEIRQIASLDPVIDKFFPHFREYLPDAEPNRHTARTIEEKNPEPSKDGVREASTDFRELRRIANILLGQIKDYEALAVKELRQLVAEADRKKKETLYRLTVAVAVGWSTKGYTIERLHSATKILLDNSIPSFVERFDKFVGQFNGEVFDYRCRVGVNWPKEVPVSDVTSASISLSFGRPPGELSPSEEKFYGRATEKEVFAEFNVSALDPLIAAQRAEVKLAEILATLNIYLVSGEFSIRGSTCLVTPRNGAGAPTRAVNLKRSKRTYNHNAGRPSERVTGYLQLSERLHQEDADQLNSALQYHKLALSAPSDEACIANLWIAVECLCRRAKGGNIIDTVCNHVVPSVAVGNPRKLIENMARYLLPLWEKHCTPESFRLFPRSTSSLLHPEDLLDAILDQKDGAKINELYRIAGGHVLLCYRLFRIRNKTLSSPKQLRESLAAHVRNVDWQIRRIYRARNHVMHQGRGTPLLPTLIQHLHTYFLVTFHNLIHDLSAYQQWTIPEALGHRRMLLEQLLRRLDSVERAFPRTALLDPAQLLIRTEAPAAWTTIPKDGAPSMGARAPAGDAVPGTLDSAEVCGAERLNSGSSTASK